MREIEIKAKLADPDTVLARLIEQGIVLSDPVTQRDIVYKEPGAIPRNPGYNFLRVRTVSDSMSYFTLKQTVQNLDKIEHETTIGNPTEMLTMIELMHYEPFSDLTKTRRSGKLGDIEICLDEVDGLGSFIEAEKICPDDTDGDAVRAELWQLFGSLDIDKSTEVTQGYDVLMRAKLGQQ